MTNTSVYTHISTKNASAIKLYGLLKDLGIKNNRFHLALYDKDLMYVDPYDPSLPLETISKIIAECSRNLWYFIREIVRIDVPGGEIMFEFQRGNLALIWALVNNISAIVEFPRQCTKTGTAATFYAWTYNFGTSNSLTSFLSKDPESVKNNLQDVKKILKRMPYYLRLSDKEDKDNIEYSLNALTGNRIITRGPPNNESTAQRKGRGSREPMQWVDEIAFTPYIKTILEAAGPAYMESARKAAINGVPYHRLFTTTPGFLDEEEGRYTFDSLIGQALVFNEKFYDQPIQDTKNAISEGSAIELLYIKFRYNQLGKSEQYLIEQKKALLNNQESYEREVLLKWSSRQSDSPFTKEQLDRIFNSCSSPTKAIIVQNFYVLRFFQKPDFSQQYIISVDCSGMLGKNNDYSSLVVIDPETFYIVATLRTNQRSVASNTTRFTYALIDIMEKIFKNALLVVEKNSMGIAIVDNIITLTNLAPRVYSSKREPNTKHKPRTGVKEEDFIYGFDTTTPRRAQMFSELIGILVDELYEGIFDETIYYEINNIVRNNKGKLEHKSGLHDDMLMSYMIGLWVLVYSRILQYYGFDTTKIRSMSILDQDSKEDYDTKAATTERVLDNILDRAMYSMNECDSPTLEAVKLETIRINNLAHNTNQVYIENSRNMSGDEISQLLYGGEDYDFDIDADIAIQEGDTEIDIDASKEIYIKNAKYKQTVANRETVKDYADIDFGNLL